MGRITGLYVGGTVQERRRRYINRDNNERIEVVTYTISDEGSKSYYVEDYAPSSYREIGSQLLEAVYVKPYKKKSGDLSYTICIKKDFRGGRGESF
jgi:hypothetical protein